MLSNLCIHFKAAYENNASILQATSGNPIWDASAQGFTILGQHPDISGFIDLSSTRPAPFLGDWVNVETATFFGLEVSNNFMDIYLK